MAATPIFVFIVAAAAVEAALIYALLSHPAFGRTPTESYVQLLFWAALPLVLSGLLLRMTLSRHGDAKPISGPLYFIAVIGPLMALLAYTQLGHASAGFLMIGFGAQVVALIYAFFKFERAA